MFLGSSLYAHQDLTFSAVGYLWSLLHILSMSLYLVLVKVSGQSLGLNATSMSLYNNALALPLFIALSATGLTEVAGAVEKDARIRRSIPWFEHGRMWLPQALNYTDVQGQQHELIQELLEVEYATFPVGRYDDGMDCLARIDEPALTLPWPDEEDEWSAAISVIDPFAVAADQITGY